MVGVTAKPPVDATAAGVRARLDALHRRIESTGRAVDEVTIIAVTKGFGPDAVRSAGSCGLDDVGENYAGELLDKRAVATDRGLRWHFLGAIQRNKVGRLAPIVDLWHGVDRFAAGEAIARRRPGARVLVQVAVDDDPRRNGVPPTGLAPLVDELRRLDLDVAGLMAVASPDPTTAARQFRDVARMGRDLGLRELSMGMTDDMELALEAGATIVRIGRGLFGARAAAAGVRA